MLRTHTTCHLMEEGRMPFRKIDQGEPDDTHGNMPFRKIVQGEVETDDTEGNAVKFRG